MGGAAPAELGRQLLGLGKSAQISRNSFGPRISVRLHCCSSGSGSDWLPSFSSSRAANFDALRAASLLSGRLTLLPARARSSSWRITSDRDGEPFAFAPSLNRGHQHVRYPHAIEGVFARRRASAFFRYNPY